MSAANTRPSMSVKQIFDLYWSTNGRNYEARSGLQRKQICDRFLAHGRGALPADQVTQGDLVTWIGENRKRWKSDWTIRYNVNTVRCIFAWAAKMSFIRADPLSSYKHPEGESRRPVTEQEFRALLRTATAVFRRVLIFLWYTGCRPGEMVRMTWADVDLVRGVVILQKHKARKKTRKARVIPLVPAAVRLLTWMRRQPRAGDGPVFLNAIGNPWNRCSLSLRLQRLRRLAGLPEDCFLYGIRHRYGTAGVLAGANLTLLSKAMGHSSPMVTHRYYVHVDNEMGAILDAAKTLPGLGKR